MFVEALWRKIFREISSYTIIVHIAKEKDFSLSEFKFQSQINSYVSVSCLTTRVYTHRNFVMTKEVLIVLRYACIYIKGTLGFSEMQDNQCAAKNKGICSVAFKILSFLLQCFTFRAIRACTSHPPLEAVYMGKNGKKFTPVLPSFCCVCLSTSH